MKLFVILILTVLTILPLSSVASCNKIFDVYCLPLDAEFYVAPSRDYILKYGDHFTVTSCALEEILKLTKNIGSERARPEDINRLRILVIDKGSNNEFFITAEKKVISGDRLIPVNVKTVGEVLMKMKNRLEK